MSNVPQIPQVSHKEAENFAKIWTYKGLAVPMTEVQTQFAVDFANVTLVSFIRMCQEQAIAAMKAAEAQKPVLVKA